MLMDLIGYFANKKKAKGMDDTRPEYRRPKEVDQEVAMRAAMAKSSRLPGQSQIENQIGQSQAQNLSALQQGAGSSADILSNIGGIQQNTMNQLGNLAAMGAEYRAANQNAYIDALRNRADYKQQEFDYNKNQEFEWRRAQKQKYMDAAMNNVNNISSDIHEFGMSMGSMGMGSMGKGGSGGGGSRNARGATSPTYSNGSTNTNRSSFFYK